MGRARGESQRWRSNSEAFWISSQMLKRPNTTKTRAPSRICWILHTLAGLCRSESFPGGKSQKISRQTFQQECRQQLGEQIALRQLWRPNANRLIGKAHGQGIPVRLAVDCDRADPELLARANDAQGDLSAISHQNLLKHVRVRVSPGDSPFHAGHSPAACPLLLRQTQKGAQARAPMSNQFTSLALLQTTPAHTQSAARSQPVS